MKSNYKAAADALASGVGQVPEIWAPDGSKKLKTREEFLEYYPTYKELFERIDRGEITLEEAFKGMT